jgi:hypothetical protein
MIRALAYFFLFFFERTDLLCAAALDKRVALTMKLVKVNSGIAARESEKAGLPTKLTPSLPS